MCDQFHQSVDPEGLSIVPLPYSNSGYQRTTTHFRPDFSFQWILVGQQINVWNLFDQLRLRNWLSGYGWCKWLTFGYLIRHFSTQMKKWTRISKHFIWNTKKNIFFSSAVAYYFCCKWKSSRKCNRLIDMLSVALCEFQFHFIASNLQSENWNPKHKDFKLVRRSIGTCNGHWAIGMNKGKQINSRRYCRTVSIADGRRHEYLLLFTAHLNICVSFISIVWSIAKTCKQH